MIILGLDARGKFPGGGWFAACWRRRGTWLGFWACSEARVALESAVGRFLVVGGEVSAVEGCSPVCVFGEPMVGWASSSIWFDWLGVKFTNGWHFL